MCHHHFNKGNYVFTTFKPLQTNIMFQIGDILILLLNFVNIVLDKL